MGAREAVAGQAAQGVPHDRGAAAHTDREGAQARAAGPARVHRGVRNGLGSGLAGAEDPSIALRADPAPARAVVAQQAGIAETAPALASPHRPEDTRDGKEGAK